MTGLLELPPQRDPELPKKSGLSSHELQPEEIADFQKLRTEYLLERGLIKSEDLIDGVIPDHFPDRSVWVGVEDADRHMLEAAGRIILTDGKSVDSLQMRLDDITNPDQELIEALRQHDPNQVGEVASLLRVGDNPRAVLHVYAGLKHVSDVHHIRYWVFGLRHKNVAGFKKVFGEALYPLGDSVEIEGAQDVLVPYLIDIGDGVKMLKESLDTDLDVFTRKMREAFVEALNAYDNPPVAA